LKMCYSHTASLQSVRLKDFSQFNFKILYCLCQRQELKHIWTNFCIFYHTRKKTSGAAVRLPTNSDKIRYIYNKRYFCSSFWI